MSRAPVPPPELLLAEAAWLRRLTSRLTRDDADADDLRQDVALAALSQPAHAELGHGWLATVARNLRTMAARRRTREATRLRAIPPDDAALPTDELVATAELQRRAVEAVLALPAEQRDTVLLRFMHGRSVPAVAREMGVPEETVRTRQRRALARLRVELAPTDDRCRSRLAALLASILPWGLGMKLEHAATAVAVALVACLAATALVVRPVSEATPSPADAATPRVARVPTPATPSMPAGAEDQVARTNLATPAEPAAATGPARAELLVHVTYVDEDTPAVGVPVRCAAPRSTGNIATTDTSGTAHFVDLSEGTCEVFSPDYRKVPVEVVAGTPQTIAMTIERGFEVDGVVVDAHGAPVADAEIAMSWLGVEPAWEFPLGRTDGAGRFTIARGREGMAVFARHARAGVSDAVLLTNRRHGGTSPASVELRVSDAVTALDGVVIDAAGAPVRGAWVQLGDRSGITRGTDGALTAPPPPTLRTTDADGRFVVDVLRVDADTLAVTAADRAPCTRTLVLEPGVRQAVTIVLDRAARVRGSIRTAAGTPLAGADVGVEGLALAVQRTTRMADDGSFLLSDLPPGPRTFVVRVPGQPPSGFERELVPGEEITVDVIVPDGPRVLGRLVDAMGQPLRDHVVALAEIELSVTTDAEGRFSIGGCPVDGGTLVVRERFGFVPELARFEHVVPAAHAQEFVVTAERLPTATITGRCVDRSGAPAHDVTLRLAQDGRPLLLADRPHAVDADGAFVLGPLPPGRYVVTPIHATLRFAPCTVELGAGERRDLDVVRGH